MPIQSYNTAWRNIVNTNTDAVAQKDSGGTIRDVNAVWVNDGTSWKKVFNTSLYDTASANKKRDMVLIGDSITWGWGLPMTQAHPYLVQQVINSRSGYVTSGWTARNITMDDTTMFPFNDGATSPTKIVASGALTATNVGPFSGYAGTPAAPFPCIALQSSGGTSFISFNITAHPSFIVFIAKGTGTVDLFQEGYVSPIATYPLTTSYQTYITSTSAPRYSTNPDFTIALFSGTNAEIISLHPTNTYNGYATGFINVIVNGRNSYAIEDYKTVLSDIKSTVINTVAGGSAEPIYVLAVGTVSMYDPARAVNPATYKTDLEALINGLKTGSGGNAGKVILTLPPKPSTLVYPSGPTLGTAAQYNEKVIELANTYGLDYIDLYNGPFVRGTYTTGVGASGTPPDAAISYQVDGIHPNDIGAQQIANRICCSLGL
jgi:lysophospholipase L1-like esterase